MILAQIGDVIQLYVDSDSASRLTFVLFFGVLALSGFMWAILRNANKVGQTSVNASETIQDLVKTSQTNTAHFLDALKVQSENTRNITNAIQVLTDSHRTATDDAMRLIITQSKTTVSEILQAFNTGNENTRAEIKKTVEVLGRIERAISGIGTQNETSKKLLSEVLDVIRDVKTVVELSGVTKTREDDSIHIEAGKPFSSIVKPIEDKKP